MLKHCIATELQQNYVDHPAEYKTWVQVCVLEIKSRAFWLLFTIEKVASPLTIE